MARFQIQLPTDIMKEIEYINKNSTNIFGEMTRAGAKVAQNNAKQNVPLQKMAQHIKLTKVYKTPSDGGINTKVYISGYIPFSDSTRKYFSRKGGNGTTYYTNKGVPADFLANLYEYGRSTRQFPQKPFFRKSFKKKEIEQAMFDAQEKYSRGILDE